MRDRGRRSRARWRRPNACAVRSPMRKRPASAPTSARYGRAGGGAVYGSPGPAPATASSTARGVADRSRQHELVRERSPVLAELRPERGPRAGGLQADDAAHRRGEPDRPAHVVAVRDGDHPGRDRGRDPPLDPPGERVRSHGLCVAPYASGSVVTLVASSGVFVLPTNTNPAARKRAASHVSSGSVQPHALQQAHAAVDTDRRRCGTPRPSRGTARRASGPAGRSAARLGAGAVEPLVDHRVERGVDALRCARWPRRRAPPATRRRGRRARPGRSRRARCRWSVIAEAFHATPVTQRQRDVSAATRLADCHDGRRPTAARAARSPPRSNRWSGQVFFAPECHAAYARLGFAPSPGRSGGVAAPDGPAYFTSRGSLLGQVAPGVVAAAFGVFKPEIVSPGVSLGWSLTDARDDLRRAPRRRGGATRARARPGRRRALARASVLLERAVEPLGVEGRPLFAGLRSWWDDPSRSLDAPVPPRRHAARVPRRRARLRLDERRRSTEWRSACSTTLYMGMPLRSYVRTRGWNDEELAAGEERLRERGWLDEQALSRDGRDAREASSGRPTGRWRPRSTRSATTSTSCSRLLEALGRGDPQLRAATSAVPSTSGPTATTDATMAARSDSADRPSVSFVCRGHRNITATHDKTLELTRDAEITRRATCVLGVASEHDDRGAARAARPTSRSRSSATARATRSRRRSARSSSATTSLVFRRGPGLRGRTIAFDATKTAADDRPRARARLAVAGRRAARHDSRRRDRRAGVRARCSWCRSRSATTTTSAARALEVLERVDLVLAEDTRRLPRAGPAAPASTSRAATSYHDHNESAARRRCARAAAERRAGRARERRRHAVVQRSRLRRGEPRGGRRHSGEPGSRAVGGARRARARRACRSTGSCSAASCPAARPRAARRCRSSPRWAARSCSTKPRHGSRRRWPTSRRCAPTGGCASAAR